MITGLEFNIPQKKDFLIFDNLKINILEKYIGKSFNVIAFRKKKYNFFALVYALIFSFKTEFKVEYINFFLNFTNKKVLISFNFNRLILYRIKKYYPSVKIIIVQNGLCNNYFIDRLKNSNFKLNCDYFFCMTDIEKNILKKYISAEFIVIGSFLNNHFYKKEKKTNKKEVLLISQYRNKESSKLFQKNYTKTIKALIPTLIYLSKKKTMFSILGSSNVSKKEFKYYRNLFVGIKFNFYTRKAFQAYKRISNASTVIGYDSTLLYEAFAIKKKIGIINLSASNVVYKNENSILTRKSLSGNGKFWIKKNNEYQMKNVLINLIKYSKSEWSNIRLPYKKLFLLDYKNKQFCNVIKNL